MKTCCLCKTKKPTSAFAVDKSRADWFQPRCRDCQRTLSSAWRTKYRELLRKKSAEYCAANPEKRKATLKAYAESHREQERARLAAWRAANREKERKRGRIYHAARPEMAKIRMAKWRAANRDKAREAIRRYRTLKTKAYVAAVDFATIYTRDNGLCQICGKAVDRILATLDHIIPLSRGGTHEPKNVQIAHGKCNSSKGARAIMQE